MNALRRFLAPGPRFLTPDRVALAAVAALAVAVTPTFLASIPAVSEELGGNGAAIAFTVLTTAALSLLVARRALRADSPLQVRRRLVMGGALAGPLDALLSYGVIVLLRLRTAPIDLAWTILACFIVGVPLGSLLGILYAPVVATAARARRQPSLDAVDRVTFAAGATLLLAGAAWLFGAAYLAGRALLAPAGVGGVIAAGMACARLVVRVRFLKGVREHAEPGFHVVPRAGGEEEAALVPLVRTEPCGGVLVATGASAPYRGERGVFKLALVPLPDEPFDRPFGGLVSGALGEVAGTMVSLAALFSAVMLAGFLCLLWVFRNGIG